MQMLFPARRLALENRSWCTNLLRAQQSHLENCSWCNMRRRSSKDTVWLFPSSPVNLRPSFTRAAVLREWCMVGCCTTGAPKGLLRGAGWGHKGSASARVWRAGGCRLMPEALSCSSELAA